MITQKDFINILDFSTEELEYILTRAAELKARHKRGILDRILMGRTLAMFFEKPSMRTRVSLEAAAASMGGAAICLDTNEGPGARLGDREPIQDIARVVGRYVDIISIRTFEHAKVEALAANAPVPVINALSDYSHPTQAMSDILTMREHLGETRGKRLVFVGDGNNVARSLAALCGRLGIRFTLSSPAGYELDQSFLASLAKACPDAVCDAIRDPQKAVADADVVYTDVWTSMGQEEEKAARQAIFGPYQLNANLMKHAPAGALVMHCLPAHRGEEVTAEVIESSQSVVFDEAENRMHLNRALFAVLLGDHRGKR